MSGFVSIAKVSDFREGKIRRYFVDGREIGVVFWQDGLYAFSNRCTHAGFQLHFGFIEDDCLNCPIHYGVWELATGVARGGPVSDLPMYEARVRGEDVQVRLDDSRVPAAQTGI